MSWKEEQYMAVLAVLAAVLIASQWPMLPGEGSVLRNYSYWTFRIGLQALLFFLVRTVIEKYSGDRLNFVETAVVAAAISHVPFVLSITAIDIVLGYPELGIGSGEEPASIRLNALFFELLYLLDNHLALCALLSVPGWLLQHNEQPQSAVVQQNAMSFLATLDPPLEGSVIWVEAQEHYVRIQTEHENRMVLARFSDVVRELSQTHGMQVHRSHWVAVSAIREHNKSGQRMNLVLSTGEVVPVSRSFQRSVLDALEDDAEQP